MIPIPKPKANIVIDHCNNVIDLIKNHTDNGEEAIRLLDFAFNKIKKGLTFYKILKMSYSDFSKIIPFYIRYKNNILPQLQKKELTINDCVDFEEKNKYINFYNSIISFNKMEYFYKKYEDEYGLQLMNDTSVKVCPYCNRYEIFNANYHKTSQFDHFIPKGFKEKYPIFALSYYNLIPACSNCNHIKTSNDLSIISPYDKSLKNDSFYFDCQILNIDKLSVKIFSKKKNKKFINAANSLNDDLELEILYSSSKNVIDIFYRIKDYAEDIINNDYLNLLKKEYAIKNKNRNLTFTKFILENYENDSDFLSYTYSKFTKDMAEKFNLFRYLKTQ